MMSFVSLSVCVDEPTKISPLSLLGADTAIETALESLAVPDAQDSVYVLSVVRGPTCSLPDVSRTPVQLPDAVHEVAFVEDHVSVIVSPHSIVVALAERDVVGGGGGGGGGGVVPPPPEPPPPPQPAIAKDRSMAPKTLAPTVDGYVTRSP
jgi:hypothetical protein